MTHIASYHRHDTDLESGILMLNGEPVASVATLNEAAELATDYTNRKRMSNVSFVVWERGQVGTYYVVATILANAD